MIRIVWTRAEKDQVLEGMIAVAAEKPRTSSKELMRQGQQVLPTHRRVVINDQRVFTYKKMIQAARDAAAAIVASKVIPEPAPEPPIPEAQPQPQARKIDGIGDLFELLVDAITDRVMEKIQAKLEEAPAAPIKVEVPQTGWLDELRELSIRKPRKKTCLVVGLNGAQIDNIKHHKPSVDFTFVTGEQALSHHTFSKDHTILMTKFINHGVHNKYRKHPNMHYCNGGVSELKYLLNGLFGV